MGLLNRIASFLDDWNMSAAASAMDDIPMINPATGLSMTGGVDVVGNTFGSDLSNHGHDSWQHDPHRSGSAFDDHHRIWNDPFTSSMGGGHDPWRD